MSRRLCGGAVWYVGVAASLLVALGVAGWGSMNARESPGSQPTPSMLEGLAESGADQGDGEPHQPVDAVSGAVPVSGAQADAYMATAGRNEPAEQLLRHWYDEQVGKHGIEGVHWVDCRGWMCKATFQFASLADANRMKRMDVSRNFGEYGFVAFMHGTHEGTDVTVHVYNTLPGHSFEGLFAGGGPDERLAARAAADKGVRD